MIKLEKTEVFGWEAAIRGMRNPMNSWDRSDSTVCAYSTLPETEHCDTCPQNAGCAASEADISTKYIIGPNDHDLMMQLAEGGSVHAKYRRMITVYVDITAPLYWWKEFDTYKIGTVANSCSTMHKIAEKEFAIEDFSTNQLSSNVFGTVDVFHDGRNTEIMTPKRIMDITIEMLNNMREAYVETGDKLYWWQMIQLLPSSYNQKRTVMMNYEVLAGIYKYRRNHKLDEWRVFCGWIEKLPYSELITGVKEE